MSFINSISKTLNDDYNYSTTENGALGYRNTGKALLDINFKVASLRNKSPKEIVDYFTLAYHEDRILAMKWLFYLRDVRGGLGERRTFRVIIKAISDEHPNIVKELIPYIPFCGRYDDLWCLLGGKNHSDVVKFVKSTLATDITSMYVDNAPISLLAKWMPSVNASSAETKRLAKILCTSLDMSEKSYRKTLSALRKHLRIVETDMSNRRWSNIDYNTVPSRANLIYNKAFLRNDEERRRQYLESLEKGEAKINAGTLFPHDIAHKYMHGGMWCTDVGAYDATLENLWKALPDYVNGNGNTIVVADGSGSMTSIIDRNSSVSALEVANSLAIYFAEHASGEFKDNYITFSSRPQLVNFAKAKSLRDKLKIALLHNEVADTNIEAVFDLILNTAVRNKMSQEDIPQNILIISDMEFNYAVTHADQRLFSVINQKYENAGYKIPRVVFWNVNSRTGAIPVIENDLGVALVSGFSAAITRMVLSNEADPYKCLVAILNDKRYEFVDEAFLKIKEGT